jgi:hypothetical protein
MTAEPPSQPPRHRPPPCRCHRVVFGSGGSWWEHDAGPQAAVRGFEAEVRYAALAAVIEANTGAKVQGSSVYAGGYAAQGAQQWAAYAARVRAAEASPLLGDWLRREGRAAVVGVEAADAAQPLRTLRREARAAVDSVGAGGAAEAARR